MPKLYRRCHGSIFYCVGFAFNFNIILLLGTGRIYYTYDVNYACEAK